MKNLVCMLFFTGLMSVAHADSSSIDQTDCTTIVSEETQILLAASKTGIVSQNQSAIQFAPGYRYRTVKRGGRTIISITSPTSPGEGTVSCGCSSTGSDDSGCQPVKSGTSVTCKKVGNSCNTGLCVIGLVLAPPPAPDPTN